MMPIRDEPKATGSRSASLSANPAATTAKRLQRSSFLAFNGDMKSEALKPSARPQKWPLPPASSTGTGRSAVPVELAGGSGHFH
ncbi:MAG TPA: hypothetical protein PKX94_04095, partial [Opitutales bacterium]|nr:hypothetical protein [Opitutales bacterium]